jgi:putative acetyltransferase
MPPSPPREDASIVVLRHPAYYPRFGFVPAAGLGIGREYGAPPAAFMLLELVPGSLRGSVEARP